MLKTNLSLFIVVPLMVMFLGIIIHSFWISYRHNITHTTEVEGFATENTKCVYFPLKKNKNRDVFSSFGINDFMRDSIEISESIKLYKDLIYKPPGENSAGSPHGEYSSAIEKTDLYKKYNNEMKPSETKYLDQMFADLFDAKQVSSLELNAIKKRLGDVLSAENKMYSYVQYFITQKPDDPYSPEDFLVYFSKVIFAYKNKPEQLTEIKTFLYKILGPSFIHTKFIDHFKSNISTYGTKNDMLYVLNTTKQILEKMNVEELKFSPRSQNVYIFNEDQRNKSDPTFTIYSLILFSYGRILLNLYSLIQENVCPLISMPNNEFASMFDAYLKKKYPNVTEKSVLVFAMDPANIPALP
jgi:hypothetical protein